MPITKSPTDLELSVALFARKRALEEFPAVDAFTTHGLARRNHHAGKSSNSLLLTKALLIALCGKVSAIYDTTTHVVIESTSPDRITKSGKPSVTRVAISQHGLLNPMSFFGATYHIGLAALGEAIVRASEAADLLEAWKHLITYTRDHLNLPLDWRGLATLNDPGFNEALLRCADELYFWMRYSNATEAECVADGPHDRLAKAVVSKSNPVDPRGSANLVSRLLDPSAWTSRAPTATAPSPRAASAAPSGSKGFKGPQKGILARSMEQRVSTLLFGQTATGKTECVNEVIGELGWGYEHVGGKEGLADLDFFGSLTKTQGGLTWVDGPLARAMRRAATEPIVVFIDEFTRIRPEQLNILIDLLNEVPEALMEKSGVTPWGKSARGHYRRVEVPQCEGVFNCPAENLVVVAACNLGRAYNVNSIDPALLRRLKRKIEFRYLKADDEITLLIEKSPVTLDRKIAQACVSVANQVRAMSATAEVSTPLDTGSLIYWTGEIAARWKSLGATARTRATAIAVAQEEAATIWIPAVLAPDLNGQMPDAKIASMNDIIRDQFTANL